MKTIVTTVLFCMSFFMLSAQKVNDKVQVESNGSWYDAVILEVNEEDQEYFIHYEGWSDSWDEWVTIDRMKGFKKSAPAPSSSGPLTKFKVGDRVEVEYGMIPRPATVIEVGENKYHVEFDKKAYGTKWVKEVEIQKL